MSTALVAVNQDQATFSEKQIEIIKSQITPEGTTNEELSLFLMYCQRTGLDPFARQIYLGERRSKKGDRWITTRKPETTIDGFRLIAERTNKYAGQLGPFWCGEDGVWRDVWIPQDPPIAARVGILRHDFKEPLWAVALYDEYCQKTSEGKPNSMWTKMPANQLAKCSESLALRRAFPRELSGLYTREEMAQADTEPRETSAQVAERRIAEERAKIEQSKSGLSGRAMEQFANDSAVAAEKHTTPIETGGGEGGNQIRTVPAARGETQASNGPERREIPPATTLGSKPPAKPKNFELLKAFRGVKTDLHKLYGDDDVYKTILGAHGYEHSSEIPSKEKGAPIYKELKQAYTDKMEQIENAARPVITDEDLPKELHP